MKIVTSRTWLFRLNLGIVRSAQQLLKTALKNSNYMGNKLLLMLSCFSEIFYCIDMVMNLHIIWSSIYKRAVWRVLVTCTNERRN